MKSTLATLAQSTSNSQARIVGSAVAIPVVRRVSAGSLGWAVAIYCTLMGALMLVVPHHFNTPAYRALTPYLPWWGGLFLLAGSALLTATALDVRRALAAAVHVTVGASLIWLAWGFATTGAISGVVACAALGIGTASAPFVAGRPVAGRRCGPLCKGAVDLLMLVLGCSAAVIGAIQVFLPQQYAAAMFDQLRPWLAWWGAAFLGGGLALVVTEVLPGVPILVRRIAHLLAAGTFLSFMVTVSLPARSLTGIAYYGGFGAAILVLPWFAPWLYAVDRRSLRTRLALAMIGIGAVPLVAAVALVANQVDRRVEEQAVRTQRVLAVAIAQHVDDDIGMHRVLVTGLAATPDVLDLPPAVQESLLATMWRAHPWFSALAILRGDGTMMPRSSVGAPSPEVNTLLWDRAQRTHAPAAQQILSPSLRRPIIAFGAPIFDANGQLSGLVTGELDTAALARDLDGASVEGREVYLVDGTGHAIARPDRPFVAPAADLSTQPPVAALLADLAGDHLGEGALHFLAPDGERLAGYAVVPELGWGVVVERPASLALAGVQAARDVAALVLLVAVVLAATLGVLTAGCFAAPLAALTGAVDALAAGDPTPVLSDHGPTEVRHLARRFGEMRTRLAAAAAERERLLESERTARTAAEQLMYQRDRVLQDVRCKLWRATITERDGDLEWDAEYINEAALRKYFPVAGAEHGSFQRYIQGWLSQRVPEDLARNREYVRQKVLAGEDYTVEFRWRRADGEVRWLREGVEVKPLGPGQWEVVGVTVDVTEERLLVEERLRRAVEAAEAEHAARAHTETERLRDEFFANVSHDLRTPLMAIKASIGVVLANEPPNFPAPLHRLLASADEAGDRMDHLIADLLELTRLRAGRVPFDPSGHDLRDVARRAAHAIEALAQARGQRLEVDLPDQPVWAPVDAGRLERALLNLLSNAQKYGRAHGTIRFVLERRPDEALFSVSDDGPGIPAADQERIFERFYRASAAQNGSAPGSGLGLAIARAMVELHGGRIWVESPPGGGATFRVAIPAAIRAPAGRPSPVAGTPADVAGVPATKDR